MPAANRLLLSLGLMMQMQNFITFNLVSEGG